MDGMMTNLDEFLGTLERFASILPGLGGAPLKLAREALDNYAKSQGVATKEVDASIPSLLNAETHSKNLKEAYDILTGTTNNLGESTQKIVEPTKQQAAAIADIKDKIEGARAGIDQYVAGIEIQVEASNSLTVKLHEENEALADNIQQTNALVGTSENYNQSLLTIGQSIADHNVKIDQLNASLNTAEGQQLSFANAVGAGNEQFLTWVQTTRDAAVQAETFKANLEGLANSFGGLPGFMEGTVEEYQAFIRANTEGGDAVEAFSDMALESWRSLVSEAEPLFNDLKSAWRDIFEGKTIEDAQAAITEANDKIAQNIQDNNDAIAQSAEGQAPKIKDIFDGVDWGAVTEAMQDPFSQAFNKLPAMVSDQLDIVERDALTFQAKFATIAENAGTTFATNLQAGIAQGMDFEQALASAKQAVADMLAPFITEHPEMAQMFDPLFDALDKTGPGAGQAVQDVLQEMSGMPGPVGDVAGEMLTNFQTEFGDKIPGVTKTGVEGAIQEMSTVMETGFQKVVDAINNLINTGIKQDPASIPEISANTNPANEAIQLIGTSLDQMKQYLTENPLTITVSTTAAGTSLDGLKTKIDEMAGKEIAISINTGPAGIALDGLKSRIDAMAGKEIAITVNTGPAGIAITTFQTQLDAVHGKEVAITVNTGPAGIAITGLQTQIDAVHGKEVAITVNTGPAGTAIREIQGQIDGVHGTNVFITVDTSGAQEAIRQLQQQINSLQTSMAGIGGGVAPGFQSRFAGRPKICKGFWSRNYQRTN